MDKTQGNKYQDDDIIRNYYEGRNQPSYVRIHASLLFTFEGTYVLPKVSSRVIKKLIKSTIKVTYVNYLNYLFYAVRIEALTYEGTVRRLDYLFTGYLANVAGRICS